MVQKASVSGIALDFSFSFLMYEQVWEERICHKKKLVNSLRVTLYHLTHQQSAITIKI